MQTVFRIILAVLFTISVFGFVEPTAIALNVENTASHVVEEITSEAIQTSLHTDIKSSHDKHAHSGPHIPSPRGEVIEGWSIFGLPITNTVFSTWIFMVLLFILVGCMYIAIRTHRFPGLKSFGLDIVNRIYIYSRSLIGDEKITKNYLWLIGGLIVVIFLGNIVGLIFDWLILISKDEWLGHYLRPIYSDLSTTLVLSLTVILVAQLTAFYLKGPIHHIRHYLWNYHGDSTAEKIVGVFVGWLHFLGEFIRIGSLSMRLFLNIFVGAILIGVVVYVGEQIPSFHTGIFRIIVLPFWFFELLVAFLQAYIFMTLSSLYIRESLPEKHN